MKKLIISVVALLASLTCFAGCAKEDFLSPVTSTTESSSTNSETSSSSSLESNVESSVESNVESSVESNVESSVESNVESSEESNVESSVESNVESSVETSEESSVETSVESSDESSTSSSVEEEDPLADAAEYLEDMYRGANKETRNDYEVVSSVFGYEITWSVDVEDIKVVQGFGSAKTTIKVSGVSEDVTYVLTATISDGEGNTKTVEFTRKALAALDKIPQAISQKPAENTPYKLYVYQSTKATDCYFTGEMSGYYFATTDVYEGTPDLYVEYIEGSDNFYVYFDKAGVKTYIGVRLSDDGAHNNVVMDTAPVSEFFWNATIGTICTHLDVDKDGKASDFYLGNYSTHMTFSASTISYAGGAGNNVGGLVEMVSKDSIAPEKKIAEVKEVLSVQGEHRVDKTIALTTVDERYPDVEISWAISESASVSLLDGELTLTIPAEAETVTLTATFTCGEATDTKVFELTLGPAIATPTTEEEIVNAAYSLAAGETLPGTYTLTGIISKVNTAYDAGYQNVTVTITVADKAIECYRLKGEGADVIKVGDTITVTGSLKNYNGKVEFDQGCTLDSFVPGQGGEVIPGAATLTFDDLAKRTSQNDDIQVWEENGVKLTNNKHESKNPINGQYYNPIRLYQSTNVVIEYAGMTKIEFLCNDYKPEYPADLVTSIGTQEGVTVTVDGLTVTVVFANAQDSFSFVLAKQVRLVSLSVYTGSVTPPDSSSDSSDDSSDVEEGELVATVPVVGKAYIFGMTQANVNNTVYYLAGGMDGYYMATTTDPDAAIETYIEATEGGYYFYTYVDGVKTYINMVVSGTHVNGAYEATASTVYTIDEAHNTLIAIVNDAEYWFGTRNDKTYTTMGPCAVSYNGFYAEFYAPAEGGNDSSEDSSSELPPVDSSDDSSTDSSVDSSVEDSSTDSSVDSSEDSSSEAPVAPDFSGELVATVPVAGKAYIFGMTQANVNNTVYYLAGGMDGYYMATTTDPTAAIATYIEATEGGYYFYTYVDGVKTYINMVVSGTHVNGAYEATASTVYTIDEAHNTLIAIVNDAEYWFGTRNDKTYTTMGPCAVSYNGFYGEFYAPAEGGNDSSEDSSSEVPPVDSSEDSSSELPPEDSSSEVPAPHVHSYTETVTAPKCGEAGYTTFTCECGDTYTGNETEALPHVDANLDIYCDNGCSVRIWPEAGTKISLFTATAMIKFSLTNDYYVEGVITDIGDAKNGIFTITDEAGDILCIKIPKNEEGISYASWTTLKVVVGDTIRVVGKPKTSTATTTSKAKAMIEGGLLTVLKHEHNFSEATCTEASVCACLAINAPALGHLNENGDNLCDRCEWNLNLKISNIVIRTDDQGNGVLDADQTFWTWENDNFSAVIAKGASTYTIYKTAKAYMQLKKLNTLTVTNKIGADIKTITISVTSATYLNYLVTALTGSNLTYTQDADKFTLTIEWNSTADLVITNNGNNTVYISGVEIVYEEKTVAPHEHSYTEEVTAPTCTEDGYKTFTCECGDTYTEAGEAATGHSYAEGTCGVCGAADPDYVPEEPETNVLLDAAEGSLSKWDYGTEFTTVVGADEVYGNYWTITFGEDMGPEQGIQHTAIDKKDYVKVYFYVFNPLAKQVRLNIHTPNTWGKATLYLESGWTLVELDAETFYDGAEGQIRFIIQEIDAASLAGEWKITSFYGLKDGETAPEVQKPEHQHSYTEVVTAPTCTEAGYTTFTCECGDSYTEAGEAATGHSYTEVATAPTCTAAGYTTFTCTCGHSYTEAGEAATGHADADADYKCDVCSKLVEPADGEALTLTQAIALAKVAGASYTTNKFYITVEIVNVYNTQYGNMNVVDADGNEFTIYGTYSYDGKTRYDALSYKPVKGDEITVYGVLGTYNGAAQMKNGWIDEVVAHTHEYNSVVTDPTCTVDGYTTYTCTICNNTYTDNVVTAPGHTTDNGTCDNCGNVIGGEVTGPQLLTTFDFGANGNAAHVDGNDLGASKSYTVGSYTLALTGMSKVYGPAYDAKGNSCIKLGTSSKTGSFSFTVADDVNKVIIYVAKYKTNTTKINVNGTAYTLTKASNDGAYDAIEVDTSSTKTVTFATVSGGVRCMVNTVEFWS